MDGSKLAKLVSTLKQMLKKKDESLEKEIVEILEDSSGDLDQEIVKGNTELQCLMFENSIDSDLIRLFCIQNGWMEGEKNGLKSICSVASILCNPVGSKAMEQVLGGLNKVRHKNKIVFVSLILCMLPCVTGQVLPSTLVNIDKNHIIFNSKIRITELQEITEKLGIEPLFDFLKQLDVSLEHIKEFKEFKLGHKACSNYGNSNDNTDSLEKVVEIAKKIS